MLVTEIKEIPKGSNFGEGSWSLKSLKKITVLFGKNGSGKSTILEWLGANYHDIDLSDGRVVVQRNNSERRGIRFEKIVPERGGLNRPEGSYLNNALDSPTWFTQQMRGNFQQNYRQMVAAKFQSYIMRFASNRKFGHPYTRTQEIISYLNELLPSKHEVFASRDEAARLQVRKSGVDGAPPINPESLSSGEREALSLGIHVLVTVFEAEAEGRHLVLLIDEPDVHLHPDLQVKLFGMLKKLVDASQFLQVVVGTHSPAFLDDSDKVGVIWVDGAAERLEAKSVPSWANPLLFTLGKGILSPLLSGVKTLLVEGSDDYQVWQQAVRSSGGRLRVVVVECGSKDWIDKYIREINKLLNSLSDPSEFSDKIIALKDRDNGNPGHTKQQFVDIYRTQCHELENCIFSNEIADADFRTNSRVADFMGADIKARFRGLVGTLPASDRSWQQRIGAEIGKVFHAEEIESKSTQSNSIVSYLGRDFLKALLS